MYKKYLKDNTCFIVPNNIKKEILLYVSSNKLLLDLSFYTVEELKKNIFFDYNEKTIYFLAKEYNLTYSDALLMIQNMYYINDSYIESEKTSKIKEMKEYLDNNDLLIYNENFLNWLNSKNIVTTYGKTNFINDKIFSLLDNIEFICASNSDKKEILEFNFIEDEVEFVANKIGDLVTSGVDINSIKLVNVSDEYTNIIDKIFKFYNLPINLNKTTSLFDLNIIKKFIKTLIETNNVEESLNLLKERDLNIDIYNKVIQCLNNYYFISDYSSDIEYIIQGLKKTNIKKNKLNNCVECIKVEEIFNEDNYYFLIGFNNRFPKFYKDEDYLSDNIKKSLGFSTSNEINKNIKTYHINKLNNAKNILITYKLKDYFNSYLVSTIADDINGTVRDNVLNDSNVSYSKKYDEVKLSKYLDEFYKFSYKNPKLFSLYNTYGKERYDSYDNSYKGIENNKYIKMKNNQIVLSYTSLDEFYKCNFKYYLNNILKEDTDTFAIYIGKVYHKVLSKIYNKNFDFEKEYNEALKGRVLTNKEEVLLIKLKEELKRDIELIQDQLSNSEFKEAICEREIIIDVKSTASVILKGTLDKVMLTEDNSFAYVVDYKTGKPKINFDNLKDGINMQLAIYMYLLRKSKDYADVFLVGCYLQKILDDDVTKEEIKLEGYTYNDLNIIKRIDTACYDKSFIKGIKVKKDGTLSDTKKVFDTAYYENVLNTIEEKINEAINLIIEGNFKINPKVVNGKNISCEYCKYKDICYKKYKDAVIISQDGDEDEQ